ncbi:MAG TPA: cobalt-precorrin-5B (C(1))-methyltransferase, partial [Desulfuromonadales bacterium]|nr:cobalt-precorrin-5B (C(1))-methyltransferase [Desulfuromonadales bacterium]
MKKPLRHGFTTGACATAAAKGAALMLADQAVVADVGINLPGGVHADFTIYGQTFTAESATCFVVKDAGDDPDVTNGVEVWATVTLSPPPLTDPLGPKGGGRGVGEA